MRQTSYRQTSDVRQKVHLIVLIHRQDTLHRLRYIARHLVRSKIMHTIIKQCYLIIM